MLVFRSINWMLHSIGSTFSPTICILFWAILYPGNPDKAGLLADPFVIDTHGVGVLLFTIELFVVGFPVRLLHFIYPMAASTVYMVATLIMHATGDSKIYPVLDWEKAPGIAAGICIAVIIVSSLVAHGLTFLGYYIRVLLTKKCCSSAAAHSVVLRYAENPAYEIDVK